MSEPQPSLSPTVADPDLTPVPGCHVCAIAGRRCVPHQDADRPELDALADAVGEP